MLLLQLFSWIGPSSYRYALVGAVMAAATVQGLSNLKHQWSILGEFSNIPQEQLVEWINRETPSGEQFMQCICIIVFCFLFCFVLLC